MWQHQTVVIRRVAWRKISTTEKMWRLTVDIFLLGLLFDISQCQHLRSAVIYHNTDATCARLNELPPLACIGDAVIKIEDATYGGNFQNPQCSRCDQSRQCRKAGRKPLPHIKKLALYQACSGKRSCIDYLSLFDEDSVWTEYQISYRCVLESKMIGICSSGEYTVQNKASIFFNRGETSVQDLCACTVSYAPHEIDIELTDVRLTSDVTECTNTSVRFQQKKYEIKIDCKKNAAYLGVRLPAAYKTKDTGETDLQVEISNVSVSKPPQMFWITLFSSGTLSVKCNLRDRPMAAAATLPNKAPAAADKKETSSLGVEIGVPIAVILVVIVFGVLLFIAYRRGALPFFMRKQKKPDNQGVYYNQPVVNTIDISPTHQGFVDPTPVTHPSSNGNSVDATPREQIENENSTAIADRISSNKGDNNSMYGTTINSTAKFDNSSNDKSAGPSSPDDNITRDKHDEVKSRRAPKPPLIRRSHPPVERTKSLLMEMTSGEVRLTTDNNRITNSPTPCQVHDDDSASGDSSGERNISPGGKQVCTPGLGSTSDDHSEDDAFSATSDLWDQALAKDTDTYDHIQGQTGSRVYSDSEDQGLYSHTHGGKFSDRENDPKYPENLYSHISKISPAKRLDNTDSVTNNNNNNVTYIQVENGGNIEKVDNSQRSKDSVTDEDSYNKLWDYKPESETSQDETSQDGVENSDDDPMIVAFC